MSKFLTAATIAAFLTMNISSAQAKPKSDCVAITKAQHSQFQKLPKGTSKATLDRMLGASCSISGYGNGMSAYGYNLSYDSKNWLVIVYQNGKQYKAGVLPVGMGLREG